MAQVKVYGRREHLDARRDSISNAIHECGITPQDVEITIFETPQYNWGIRGLPADELTLDYPVTV